MEKNIQASQYTGEKNYDSDFCGSIPLNLINLIQPHGFLLIIDEAFNIRQISENIIERLSVTADDLLGEPISRFIAPKELENLQHKLHRQFEQEKIPLSLSFKVGESVSEFTATIHPFQNYVLIELEEERPNTNYSFIEFFQQIKYIASRIKQSESIDTIAQVAAEELKSFTGFDRVLIYRFDPQWNGNVIGQAKDDDMSDLLGLRFPASDVPKQARDLYHRNPYRLIPAREYKPVRLLPVINPITQRFTDLSECTLRSVATVHLEYLKNLGISASMSLPIITNNKLWGLISCHHKTPKYPGYEERTAMELLSTIISVQLAAREKETNSMLQAELRAVHTRLLEQVFSSRSFTDGMLSGDTTLSELLGLTGAAIVYEGNTRTTGNTPPPQKIKELVSWLRRNSGDKTFATNSLPSQYANSIEYKDQASGLIALAINSDQGEYILGFREEVLQTVNWGGNPDHAIQMEPDGKNYHPRNSFALYQETVKHTALPWKEEELEAAEALRSAILEKIIREKY